MKKILSLFIIFLFIGSFVITHSFADDAVKEHADEHQSEVKAVEESDHAEKEANVEEKEHAGEDMEAEEKVESDEEVEDDVEADKDKGEEKAEEG